MLLGWRKVTLETRRLTLRLPRHTDFRSWTYLRQCSRDFLVPWEPAWSHDHLSRKAFSNRVFWARRSAARGTGLPLFLARREDGAIVGAVTLDNIRRGPSQSGALGYWVGEPYARRGYMLEALETVVCHAFSKLDLSRIEAACLPDNIASRGLLEKVGFHCEGSARSFLQINGCWRDHVLYAILRSDRDADDGVGGSSRWIGDGISVNLREGGT